MRARAFLFIGTCERQTPKICCDISVALNGYFYNIHQQNQGKQCATRNTVYCQFNLLVLLGPRRRRRRCILSMHAVLAVYTLILPGKNGN